MPVDIDMPVLLKVNTVLSGIQAAQYPLSIAKPNTPNASLLFPPRTTVQGLSLIHIYTALYRSQWYIQFVSDLIIFIAT